MSDTVLDFIVYVIEEYKLKYDMSGKKVLELFDKYQVVEYIKQCYEALHTFGTREIIWNIDEYIKNYKET